MALFFAADVSTVTQNRKGSVLVDDITQTLSQLYDTVYPPKLPEPLVPTQYHPPPEPEKVISPTLKDRIAVFSVEKIENIPNPSIERKPSVEKAGIESKQSSVKNESHSVIVKQTSLGGQIPSRDNSVKNSGSIKLDNTKFPPVGETHSVVVNKHQSLDQHIPSRENSLKNGGSVKGFEQTQANLVRSGSTQVEGKHVTILSVGGGKSSLTASKSSPLPKVPTSEHSATRSKTFPKSNGSGGAIKGNQSITLNSGSGFTFIQTTDGTTAAGNQQGLVGNSQFYSLATDLPGETTTAAPQTGSQTEYAYSVVKKPGNRTDVNLYSTVDQSKTSHTSQNGKASSDAMYESVLFKDPAQQENIKVDSHKLSAKRNKISV